jgi:PPOX class probable F420-dependent enzyme
MKICDKLSACRAKEENMAGVIPEKYLDLFEKKAFAHLATVMPDGSPQVTPIWIDFDGSHVLVNSARGRQKDKNMKRNPAVSLSLSDPDNPYRYLEVRGRVVAITEEGASEHINSMAKKYLGVDEYPYRQPGEVRVLYKIEPLRVTSMG